MDRANYASGTPWEPLIGFSRAVRVDNVVYVSGTTPSTATGEVVGSDDAYAQTKKVLSNVKTALESSGATMKDVVRTRLFVTDISRLEEIARAHREAFEEIRPATTIVQVEKLIDPRMLVNMEVEACIGAHIVANEDIKTY